MPHFTFLLALRRHPSLPIIVVTLLFCLRIIPYLESYRQKFDIPAIHNIYTHSQFATRPENRLFVIQDWELYPYAGVIYLTTGNLSQINIEHPPFGKYILGLSTLLTGTPLGIQIILGLMQIYMIYHVATHSLGNTWLGSLVAGLFLREELYIFNLTHGLLDQLFATLITLFLYLYIRVPVFTVKQASIQGIVLGLLASTKFPVPAIILGGLYLGFQTMLNRKEIFRPAITFISTTILIYLLTYLPLLLDHGLTGFINQHIEALKIHLSHVPEYPPFSPLRVMFFNQ